MMDRLWVPYSWLVFDGTEDFVDGEPQRDEVLLCLEGSEWIQRENWERLLLEGGLPPNSRFWNLSEFSLRVHLLLVLAAFEGVVDKTLHSFLQLNVRMGSG